MHAYYRKIRPVWEEATEVFNSTLTDDEKMRIGYHGPVLFTDLVNGTKEAKSAAESKQWPFTRSVQNIFETISRYAVVGDVIAQIDPTYTALAWGSIKFLLQVISSTPSQVCVYFDCMQMC